MGANNNIRKDNDTALYLTTESDNMDVMKLLPDKGMSVNLNSTRDATTLHVSAPCGNLEEEKLFVERGAVVYGADKSDHTSLMLSTAIPN
jgi:ankyrin repeat protein